MTLHVAAAIVVDVGEDVPVTIVRKSIIRAHANTKHDSKVAWVNDKA